LAHDEQLAWEARAGKPAGIVALLAAVAGLASGLYLPLALTSRGSGTAELLEAVDREPGDFVVVSVIQAISVLLVIPPLLYLFRATRHRRRELMPAAGVLLVLGGITIAIVTVVGQLERIDVAHDFFPTRALDRDEAADDAIRDGLSPAVQGIGVGGALALAFSMVMISLNAMRAGLLSRFMGILGVILGVVFVIPLSIQPVLQLFWLSALGVLLLGRWPGGRGPAWQTGEAVPWPGAAEQREEIARRRAEREGEAAPDAETEAERPKPASRKRRKKRR
jgi:hypothetical protein